MLNGVQWGEYRLGDLFDIVGTKSLDSNAIAFKEKGINFVGRTGSNNGIQGKIDIQNFQPNEADTITATVIGNYKYVRLQKEQYYCSQNINKLTHKKELISKWNDKIAYFFISYIQRFVSLYDSQQGGYTLDDIRNFKIRLPINNNQIDFNFMENFIAQLEATHLTEMEFNNKKELDAYLTAACLKDYELTDNERDAVEAFENNQVNLQEVRLEDLFEIKNTSSFNKDKLKKGVEYDYITRTSQNQGILDTTAFVNEENINPSGVWSLGLLQMDFFYRKRPWYAGQFVRAIYPKIDLDEKSVKYFSTIFNQEKRNLLSGLVRDVDQKFYNTRSDLPVSNNEIDFQWIENFMSAIQKLVIKDLVDYNALKLKTTKNIIDIKIN